MAEMKILDKTKMPSLVEWYEEFCSDNVVEDINPDLRNLWKFIGSIRRRIKKATSSVSEKSELLLERHNVIVVLYRPHLQ